MKRLNKTYVDMFIVATLFLIVVAFAITFIFTLGDLNSPIIIDIDQDSSGVYLNKVVVDDRNRDYFFYKGLNYTESANGLLPSGSNQNIYPDSKLVDTTVIYKATDLNTSLKGYVSLTELQDEYEYNKFYPVNNNGTPSNLTDDYITIELIENPFTNRPNNKVFNGWYTSYENAKILYDNDYYIRYANVPITYSGDYPNVLEIEFNTSWITSSIALMSNYTWTTVFNAINAKQMTVIDTYYEAWVPYDMAGYFHQVLIPRNASQNGYYDYYGVIRTGRCRTQGGCLLYQLITSEPFDPLATYYELLGGVMTLVNNGTIPPPTFVSNYLNDFNVTYNMAGFYRQVSIAQGNSIAGYYDVNGDVLSGNCGTSGGCTVYELIDYYDSLGVQEIIDTSETYYYMVTRDTNIIVLNTTYSTTWGTGGNKPFTFTSVHNGTDYRTSGVYWNVNTLVVRAYNDLNIENMYIYTTTNVDNTTPASGTTNTRFLYGNWFNVRVGRGITRNGNYVNFRTILGGNNNSVGSSGNVKKYRLIIESGKYSTSSLVNGATTTSTTNYVEAKGIYGNDYDKATNTHTNLDFYFCSSGSWGGRVYASTAIDRIFDLTVKSGNFGSGRSDNTTGIYVGGRAGGTHNGARAAKVEGGIIYNLLGGPLTATNRSNYNDSYIYVTGGSVDVVMGGGATTATYGNRIVQVTGGTINYSVFGGSNGYDGTGSDGTIMGSSFIYVGGNSKIGSDSNVTNNVTIYGAESGSVFGIGNGRSGYASIGSCTTSNIIIDESAVVGRNVYGGGNFGAVGISSGLTTTSTNITIAGGTINGSVYGGGNNNGAGNASVSANVNIETTGGTINGSLYGGSNELGTIYGNVNLNIVGGTIGDSIYGGGRGGYQNTTAYGTYVRDDINIVVGSTTSIPIVTNNIYGGSAFGSVNTISQSPSISAKGIDITINNIEILGSVFGGNKGAVGYNPVVAGNIEITVNDGNIPSLFGGNDLAGTLLRDSTIYLNGGDLTNVYGGGNQVEANITNIFLQGSIVGSIYGGSNQSGDVDTSNITLTSGTCTTVYGGNNVGGETSTTNITSTGGTISTIYGGGNLATSETTNIVVNGGTITTVYGGGKLASTDTTNITLNATSVPNVYGGGESADVTLSTNITLNGSSVTNLFGGSNQSGTVTQSNIDVLSGSATNVYGGNNAGGTTTTTSIDISGGTLSTVYGGGKLADTNQSNIVINSLVPITNVYGGGESANINSDSNVTIQKGTITNIFGGSNVSGTVTESNIIVTTGDISNIYGGNNMGGTTTDTYITINNGSIDNVFGGGNQANTSTSNVVINNSSGDIIAVYGGGNAANITTSNVDINGGSIINTFGGSNQSGTVTTSNIIVTNSPSIDYIYGGNNMGGTTIDSNVYTSGGTIIDIYGGGNQAQQSGNTNLEILNTTIENEIYGGGKDGVVTGNTQVKLTNSSVGSSVYAGGKGVTAVVNGNTILNIEGSNNIVNHVFGGGNAGATGTALTNNSSSIVNITGGNIGGNVYGGANTSVVYGTVELNIGYGLSALGLINDDINIGGTVFGGGEANASGSEEFDFSFISVTTGIDINIKEDTNNTITIDGSIFGSGNASSTTGYSNITIENYGTSSNHKRNISIQRADLVVLDNSVIELFGATDRTNEYSSVLFTISRVQELKLKNNSTIYLETGTNLLQKFSSFVDVASVETLAEVTIDSGVITKNVDNRVYALDGKNINIATNQAVTTYGEVKGMTFFGMYIRDFGGNVEEAFYSKNYDEGDTVLPGEFYTFSSGSYVLGAHVINHDIEVDGFYTNYENENTEGVIEVKYIIPTPESSNYYMWTIGEAISSYEIDLIASKFSTLGSYELPLINTPEPNVLYSIVGVNYNNLSSNFELVDKNSIPRISPDGTADTKMSLVMESSNTGWITVGETTYLTDPMNPIDGEDVYLKENSSVVPTLLFNLYHSKNLITSGSAGSITISLIAIVPIDDLTNDVVRINIIVNITRELFSSNEYEGAMTPGEKHDYFVSTAANVTNKSKLTAYYGLYVESPTTIYQTGYNRTLVSSYVMPENTKFTMIDLTTATPTYYYYEVSAADVVAATQEFAIHNEASYKLSKFIKMGSTTTTNNYDDALQNSIYYDSVNQFANEEFIFIVDFGDSGFVSDVLNQTLLIELRDAADQTMIGVLGINYNNLTYNLYNNKDSVIDVSAAISDSNIYIGESTSLNVTTNFIQQVVSNRTIQDTTFYNKKMGLKLTIYDSNNNILNASSLLGVTFTHNSVTYYPRMDGTVRINVSPRIANVYSQITINTTNSTLQSGTYRIKIDSFGSFDGIYYGLVPSDTVDVNLSVLNNIYGLSSTLSQNSTIIDSLTGQGTDGSNMFVFNLKYSSGVSNPKIIISLKRRKYDTIYSLDYEPVDILNYVTNSYYTFGLPANKQYILTETPQANQDIYVFTEPNLVTGTYKLIFSLYDGTSYIGEVYNYLVIR